MRNLLERLTGRTAAIVAALVLAAVATVALRDYVRSAEQEAVADADLVTVYVARGPIEPLIDASLILQENFAVATSFPRDLVPDDAVTNPSEQIRGFVAVAIRKDEILRTSMFSDEPPPTAAFEVPPGQVAVSIDVEATPAVANFLDPDDHVNILVHLPGGGGELEDGTPAASAPTTRYLLQDVRILAIGRRITAGVAANQPDQVTRDDALLTITVAVDSVDAERLVYAQLEGTLYLTLLPERVDDYVPTDTTGRNSGNLFQR